jgi:hypothetical protein
MERIGNKHLDQTNKRTIPQDIDIQMYIKLAFNFSFGKIGIAHVKHWIEPTI